MCTLHNAGFVPDKCSRMIPAGRKSRGSTAHVKKIISAVESLDKAAVGLPTSASIEVEDKVLVMLADVLLGVHVLGEHLEYRLKR